MQHDHDNEATPVSKEEKIALLKYMAHHNKHHAEELKAAAETTPVKTKEQLMLAAELMERSGKMIESAIDGWEE